MYALQHRCMTSKIDVKGPKTIAPTRFLTSLMSNIRCGKRYDKRCESNIRYGC